MRNWLTNIPHGKYKIKAWIRNEQEDILDTTEYVTFEILNAPRVIEDYHLWYTENVRNFLAYFGRYYFSF